MSKRKRLLTLAGTVLLLLSLTVPMMQCAPSAEEVTPPAGEEVTPPTGEEVTPPAGEIKYGGRLTVGFLSPLPSLTQGAGTMYTNWGCLWDLIVYDNLTKFNLPPDYYAFTPEFVQSYETSDDGLSWTLHLAEGATWHDGVPVTAEDVAFTFEAIKTTPGMPDTDFCVDHCEIIDDYTLKVFNTRVLTAVNPPGWWAWDPILPKHIFEPYKDDITLCPNEESIGSGPFKMKEFKPSEYMWMEAYEDYYGEKPYVDEVVFKLYGTLESMLMALKSGEIDAMDSDLPNALIEEFEANPDIKVETVQGLTIDDVTFNLHKDGPLQNKDVRHAIAYGIDAQRIIDMAYAGNGVICDSWAYAEDPLHNPNLPQYLYDPDKANQLLDGAGYIDSDGDGIRNDPVTGENLVFEMIVSSATTSYVKGSTLIQEMLPIIGIDIDVSVLDPDTFYSMVYNPVADAFDMALRGEDPSPFPYGDWMWMEAQSWDSGGAWWNPSYYDNPRYDELCALLGSARTMEERKEYVYEMQELLSEDLPEYYLARSEYVSAYRTDKFEGWVNEVGGPVSWFNDWSIMKVHLK
ncbi:MAG: peptide ABC transporter substrate-binding protein [Dehalococcoidia bacterium]|nr:peptide ABC transporter substrate-binding protein [Dehalococcoidia bacterium]